MSRTPDLNLSVMDKTTGARSGKIGAAWHNEDGSISIVLNPGASLVYNPNLVVMLFPNTPKVTTREQPDPTPQSKHRKWLGAGMPKKGVRRAAVVKEGLGARATRAPFPFSPEANGVKVSGTEAPTLPFPHGPVSANPEPENRRTRKSTKTGG